MSILISSEVIILFSNNNW